MEKSNSIINSLKRLERVGSETSVCTKKLKKAVCEIANKIYEQTQEFCDYGDDIVNFFVKITGEKNKTGLRYFVCGGRKYLLWDIDYQADECNFLDYCISESSSKTRMYDITRFVALSFAKAISDGLLDEVTKYIEQKKYEAENAIKQLENAL